MCSSSVTNLFSSIPGPMDAGDKAAEKLKQDAFEKSLRDAAKTPPDMGDAPELARRAAERQRLLAKQGMLSTIHTGPRGTDPLRPPPPPATPDSPRPADPGSIIPDVDSEAAKKAARDMANRVDQRRM